MPRNKYTVEDLITKLREAEVALSKGQTVVPPSPNLPAPYPPAHTSDTTSPA